MLSRSKGVFTQTNNVRVYIPTPPSLTYRIALRSVSKPRHSFLVVDADSGPGKRHV